MDDLENKTSTQPDLAESQSQQCCLQRQIFTLFILLFVVSGTLNVYLWRQFRSASGELNRATQTKDMMDKGNTNIGIFLNKLAEFGRIHPDFVPTLNKYGIQLTPAPAANPPPATPPKK